MKPKLKARRMWCNFYGQGCVTTHRLRRDAEEMCESRGETVRVAVIPLNDVETTIRVAVDAYTFTLGGTSRKTAMIAALTAIGILPKKRSRK